MRLWHLALLLFAACSPGEKTPEPKADPAAPAPSQAVSVQPAPPSQAAEIGIDAASSGQSFLEGMKALCQSIDAVPSGSDPADHQRQMARWIETNVSNAQVRELFTLIGEMPPSQRPGMLSAAAAKAGLQTCALAER